MGKKSRVTLVLLIAVVTLVSASSRSESEMWELAIAGKGEANGTVFQDVPSEHPPYGQIELLRPVTGCQDAPEDSKVFCPDYPISRAPFAKLIARCYQTSNEHLNGEIIHHLIEINRDTGGLLTCPGTEIVYE